MYGWPVLFDLWFQVGSFFGGGVFFLDPAEGAFA